MNGRSRLKADAQAIAEAVTRPTMRFVAVKSADQQAMLMLHRLRELLVRQRTMLATALRAHLAEFVIVAPQGIHVWKSSRPRSTTQRCRSWRARC